RITWSVFAVVIIKVVVAFVILLVAVMLYIWAMRKVIADMQNRIGPNRAGPYGVLQTLADGIKLFFKEQSIPDSADRPVFRLAPYLSIMQAGTLSTHDIFIQQHWTNAWSFVTHWFWLKTCIAFGIFLIAATAETNHPPFDLVEAEQELVGGFNTEYTGIRFAIFFLAEF